MSRRGGIDRLDANGPEAKLSASAVPHRQVSCPCRSIEWNDHQVIALGDDHVLPVGRVPDDAIGRPGSRVIELGVDEAGRAVAERTRGRGVEIPGLEPVVLPVEVVLAVGRNA